MDRTDFCKPFESILFGFSCFVFLSEHASRTFIYYEKIIHAWGQKNGPRSSRHLWQKSCTFDSSNCEKNCGNHSLRRDTHWPMGVYRVAPAGLTCTGDPPLMGLDGSLTAPPGLTTGAVSGRRRQGGSVHQERKSRGKSCCHSEGRRLEKWLSFPNLAAWWDLGPCSLQRAPLLCGSTAAVGTIEQIGGLINRLIDLLLVPSLWRTPIHWGLPAMLRKGAQHWMGLGCASSPNGY